MDPAASQGTAGCAAVVTCPVVVAGDFSAWCQAVEPGMAVLPMEIMQGWDTRKSKFIPMSLWSICFSLSLCAWRNAMAGTSMISFGLHLLLLLPG